MNNCIKEFETAADRRGTGRTPDDLDLMIRAGHSVEYKLGSITLRLNRIGATDDDIRATVAWVRARESFILGRDTVGNARTLLDEWYRETKKRLSNAATEPQGTSLDFARKPG